MSKLQTLRALVIERLAAAAEEISALFERATAEYEEELCGSQDETQRRQQLLGQAMSPRVLLNQGLNFTPTPRIKEEPEEEQQLPVPVPESRAVCVKREEDSSEQLMETEADGEDHNQVQSRERRTKLSPNKSAPETTVHHEDKSGPDAAEQKKKHQCSVCSKRFRGRIHLERHIRVHTGEKPYSCSSCEKTFSQLSNLKTHRKTHTGEKPFTCLVCEKTFSRKCNLQRHMKTH